MPFQPTLLTPITPRTSLSSLALAPIVRQQLDTTVSNLRALAAAVSTTVLLVSPNPAATAATAEGIAHALGRTLIRINTSQIVSKYIGETEKNLAHLYQTTDPQTSILFFDEAEALFGKRAEVKDAHDRYANLATETTKPCHQPDCFPGIILLASTSSANTIPAELIHYTIHLPADTLDHSSPPAP